MKHFTIAAACLFFNASSFAAPEQVPLPEHPRPDFQRAAWVNLNGRWAFAFDASNAGLEARWFEPARQKSINQHIIVPFPWESRLSGMGKTEYKGVAWYARDVKIPSGEGWDGKDAWLVIGACDFESTVWVNGKQAGSNIGGYLPFEINLAPFAKPGEIAHVVVRVVDNSDPQQPTGKQVNWYTRTSGIWQTVYLEARHPAHIISWRCTPSLKDSTASFAIKLSPTDRKRYLSVMSPDGKFSPVSMWCPNDQDTFTLAVNVSNPQPWSPDEPNLYPCTINLADGEGVLDSVESYFALREVGIDKAPGRDLQYIQLNGKPVYLAGALHQSFHPAGIYQYPDDATVRSDYELCKQVGINMLRIHIKIPTPRELYWADKLGVLIMQDMPCFWKWSKQAQDWFEPMLRGAIARDFNHPSIFAWVDFNETWGIGSGGYSPDHQKWVEQMYKLTRELDATRPVEDNSPCNYDHTITDINSWHFYINDYEAARRHIAEVVDKTHPGSPFNFAKGYLQGNQPLMNSEYGGISAGHGDQDISWCFKFLTNELRRHDKICGYIYTELSDIEWEHNGFANYDRSAKEYGYDYWFPGFSLKDINSPDFVVIDAPPLIEMKPGESRDIPLFVSHWSDRKAGKLRIRWGIRWPDGQRAQTPLEKELPAEWRPFAVTPQKPLHLAIPPIRPQVMEWNRTGLAALQVELVGDEEVLARNYVNLQIHSESRGGSSLWPEGPQRPGVGGLDMQFKPGDYAAYQWGKRTPPLVRGIGAEKVSAPGAGAFEYHLRLPKAVQLADVRSVQFMAELASRAGDAKLDWPERRRTGDYPQTDVRKWPTRVKGSINGRPIIWNTRDRFGRDGVKQLDGETLVLPDDPADARGVLTHAREFEPGSYGYLVCGNVDFSHADVSRSDTLVLRLEVPADQKPAGGLSIFGAGLGRFTRDPELFITLRKAPKGASIVPGPVAVDRLADLLQVAIPTAEDRGQFLWRYTAKTPAETWTDPAFDDSAWKQGRGGFGAPDTPNAIIGTRWNTPDIWLRGAVDVEDASRIVSATWRIYHDEDAQIFINGRKVLEKPGYVTNYEDEPLSPAAMKLLQSGRNVIAVHCHQTLGGQNIDVGLTLTRKPERH